MKDHPVMNVSGQPNNKELVRFKKELFAQERKAWPPRAHDESG